MKKVPKSYENIIQNTEVKKHSQSVYFEDENESVSLVQIGENIKVVSKPVFSKIQQNSVNALTQYLKKQYRIHNKNINT